MPFAYWSACCESFPPAGATEGTGQRVQRKREHSKVGHRRDERVELQMVLESDFAAMRVFGRNLRGDIGRMDMLRLRLGVSKEELVPRGDSTRLMMSWRFWGRCSRVSVFPLHTSVVSLLMWILASCHLWGARYGTRTYSMVSQNHGLLSTIKKHGSLNAASR